MTSKNHFLNRLTCFWIFRQLFHLLLGELSSLQIRRKLHNACFAVVVFDNIPFQKLVNEYRCVRATSESLPPPVKITRKVRGQELKIRRAVAGVLDLDSPTVPYDACSHSAQRLLRSCGPALHGTITYLSHQYKTGQNCHSPMLLTCAVF